MWAPEYQQQAAETEILRRAEEKVLRLRQLNR
jgi:hypothetical protein